MRQIFQLTAMAVLAFIVACGTPRTTEPAVVVMSTAERDSTQLVFWQELQKLCGYAYQGEIVAGGENDTVFGNKDLIMHVRACSEDKIRIPFFVGSDSSRTWVLTRSDAGLLLKHDHRHDDGTPDEVTMYGGMTSNFGASYRQYFPADQETANMLPAAIGNIWWIDVVPGEYFSYNLRRVNTPRLFSVRFDLTSPVDEPGAPWGWED